MSPKNKINLHKNVKLENQNNMEEGRSLRFWVKAFYANLMVAIQAFLMKHTFQRIAAEKLNLHF